MLDEPKCGRTDDKAQADAELVTALAAVHCLFGRYRTAQDLLQLSLKLFAQNPEAWQLKAIVSLQLGAPEDALTAIEMLESVGAQIPDDLLTLRTRAMAARQASQDTLTPVNG